MIPIVATLLKEGLALVGNAVLAKGTAYVKEKTGVDLSKGSLSSEDAVKLRQFELEHEEELLRIRQEDDRLEQAYFKLEAADRDSARLRDTELSRAGGHNWRGDVMTLGAFVVVCLIMYAVWHAMEVNEFTKGIITLLLGRFLGYLDNIYSFEFGTTRSSRAKDASIEQLSRGGRQ